MAQKKTQREFFTEIIAVVTEAGRPDLAEFCEGRIKVLDDKKANKKPTKTQEANEALKAEILEILDTEKGMTVTEILTALGNPELTGPKVTSLVTQLLKAEKVDRTVEKKKAYFTRKVVEE